VQKIAQPLEKARDQAAKVVGTNKQYVSDVKKIKETRAVLDYVDNILIV
jgi:hypothetical protein